MSGERIESQTTQYATTTTSAFVSGVIVPPTNTTMSPIHFPRILPHDRITIQNDIRPILDSTLERIQIINDQVTGIADKIIVLFGKPGVVKAHY